MIAMTHQSHNHHKEIMVIRSFSKPSKAIMAIVIIKYSVLSFDRSMFFLIFAPLNTFNLFIL